MPVPQRKLISVERYGPLGKGDIISMDDPDSTTPIVCSVGGATYYEDDVRTVIWGLTDVSTGDSGDLFPQDLLHPTFKLHHHEPTAQARKAQRSGGYPASLHGKGC